MHHCVGGYDRECMTGRTQIFSLRTARGKRLSTLQLSARKNAPREILLQRRAKSGSAQCTAAKRGRHGGKRTALRAKRGQGAIPCRLPPAAPRSADMHVLCGFDYRSDAAWEQARAGALPFLPPDLQRLVPMDFAASVTTFSLKQRCEQPELNEPDDDHEDFERRILRWIQ